MTSTVIVAMSGGVDSSTVAALMKDQGYNVIGVTLQLYSDSQQPEKNLKRCCGIKDIYDAKRVADAIGIPHYVLNYEDKFKEKVIKPFVDSYLEGETPIPCILCNQTVKFQDLLKASKEMGGDFLATGHYIKKHQPDNAKPELHVAADPTKDQSYFLFSITNEQLPYLLFPLGDYEKSYTRELAKKYKLPTASKSESQDICFVKNKYTDLIKQYTTAEIPKGNFIHIENNKIIGEHKGIINYTIGQRQGLGLSYPIPLYVIKIDKLNNQVFVGPKSALEEHTIYIDQINWIGDNTPPSENEIIQIKIRSYNASKQAKIVMQTPTQATITCLEPAIAISPGQACVIYRDSRMLGGGWIKNINT